MRTAILVAALMTAGTAAAQAPPARAPAAPAAPPASAARAPSAPVARSRAATEPLFGALKQAGTEEAAAALEAQIQAQWANSASPAIKLLLSRGDRELSESAANDALDSFDAALDLDPDVLNAWRGRASARVRTGDTTGAARDLQEMLKREPRSFAAWQDLSHVAEARGDWRGALAAWQKLLDIDPRSPGAQARLKELRRKVLGEDA